MIGVAAATVVGIGVVAASGQKSSGSSKSTTKPGIVVNIKPGTIHVTGFKENDYVTLVLPPGAKWGGATDYVGVTPPHGADPFSFNDGLGVTQNDIGVTWWDANDVAQGTTIYYGP